MGRSDAARAATGWLEHELAGCSPFARQLRQRVRALARVRSTVLLTGATGTGKGLVARVLHRAAPWSDQPFVHVDCAALAGSVIESELFGHERGAFTGAGQRHLGRIERAGVGTLFLDEIGELPPSLQAKLLRVLQEREYERVGGTHTIPMRARVVAATSRDLSRERHSGRFRADLYFRLSVVEIPLPPLRERLVDLPDLIATARRRLAMQLGEEPPAPSPGLLVHWGAQGWPGNVRELFNRLEQLGVEGRSGSLARDRLPAPAPALPGGRSDDSIRRGAGSLDEARERIALTLALTGGNVARAARRLGIPRSTLRHRIARFGLARLIPRD